MVFSVTIGSVQSPSVCGSAHFCAELRSQICRATELVQSQGLLWTLGFLGASLLVCEGKKFKFLGCKFSTSLHKYDEGSMLTKCSVLVGCWSGVIHIFQFGPHIHPSASL